MKTIVLLFILFVGLGKVTAQGTGTITDPFTILGQALTVPSAGIYYFDLGGTTFNTYVDAFGYVQVARDYGNGIGNLPQSAALNNTTRGILTPAALATLSGATDVKITTTGGSNVINANATIISRVANNQTLHGGKIDNTLNNGWTGTNAATFTGNATCNSTHGSSLHQNIIHPCGNASTFHWIPSNNKQRDPWNTGQVANSASFVLWVRDNSSPLPIELIDFGLNINQNRIDLYWTTSSERNNELFTIEKSKDGLEWAIVGYEAGAGNSEKILHYSFSDESPLTGLSYYRLKQTDFNGDFDYSDIQSALFHPYRDNRFSLFPNPSSSFIRVLGVDKENIIFTNCIGVKIELSDMIKTISSTEFLIDISGLENNIYFISDGVKTIRFVKK